MAFIKDATSSCRQCGACCNQNCPHFSWVAIKDRIRKNEKFKAGANLGIIRAHCAIFDINEEWNGCTLDQRQNFPYDKWQTPIGCGIRWIEAVPLES